jgi:mRNA interferase RelE/StbE
MQDEAPAKEVRYSREAARSLLRIGRRISHRIRRKIDLLAADPGALANNVRSLKGDEGLMRLRIGGWRVIYSDDGDILVVLKIAPRGSAYD